MAPRNVDAIVSDSLEKDMASDLLDQPGIITPEIQNAKKQPLKIVWRNVVAFVILHLAALYGFFLLPWAKPATWGWFVVTYLMNAFGITAGAHRLWTHRAYRAKLPLRILLAMFNSMAFQNDIIEWSRDHRMHHKYTETDADPHNANRGFFFSHCGWLMCRKHAEVKEKGKTIDMSDLLNDPVCAFQRKFYLPSVVLMCFVFPTVVPWYYWNESAWMAFYVCAVLRYTAALNVTWTVNSVAHLWGNKPYDSRIWPSENILVTAGACGEGFHNFHHVFPFDYATSEYAWRFNLTTFFIDCMAAIGLAYDRRKTAVETVKRRMERTGDGSAGFGYKLL
jgi:stearoyl-CoA desaturase (delta-9 desaturase)